MQKNIITTAMAVILAILLWYFKDTEKPAHYGIQKARADLQLKSYPSHLEKIETIWDQLLRKFVNDQGEVNYRDWKTELEGLDEILSMASAIDSRMIKGSEKLSFFINLYNILTIRAMLDYYPIKSIRERVNLVGFNIWKDTYVYLKDRKVSLDQIEHEILRKMDEPRIHFAIVCASISCPRLLNRAYRHSSVLKQLEKQSSEFFTSERHMRADPIEQKVRLSSIISWFREDFGSTDPEVLSTLEGYLDGPTKKTLKSSLKDFKIDGYLDYDWNLNGY